MPYGRAQWGCLILVSMLASDAWARPDTLVVRDEKGAFGAGVATAWEGADNRVTFTLAGDVDAVATAQFLNDRLSTGSASVVDGKLVVMGVPAEVLLEQLSTLSLSGGADPLAELAGLGGAAVALTAPEGGGSIRASKPAGGPVGAAAGPLRSIADHNPDERAVATVESISTKEFPHVELVLKIKQAPRDVTMKKILTKGRTIHAPVVFVGGGAGIDFSKPQTQRNIAAYYLLKGDTVQVHLIDGTRSRGDAAFEIDWIERQK